MTIDDVISLFTWSMRIVLLRNSFLMTSTKVKNDVNSHYQGYLLKQFPTSHHINNLKNRYVTIFLVIPG